MKIYPLITVFVLFVRFSYSQVMVSNANPLSNGTYSSLTGSNGAFSKIDSFDQTGHQPVITITADLLNERGTVFLKPGNWDSLVITSSGNRVVHGSLDSAIVTVSASHVIFDGALNGGSLTFANSSKTINAVVIEFYTGASFNTLRNCIIKSANTALGQYNSGGALVMYADYYIVGTQTGNQIHDCSFEADTAGYPAIAIQGKGYYNTSSYIQNVAIYNNTFADYLCLITSSYNIYTGARCQYWTISNNKFFQTTPKTNADGIYIAIYASGTHGIYNNIIGYSNASSTGFSVINGYNSGETVTAIEAIGNVSVQGNKIGGWDITTFTSGNLPFVGIEHSGETGSIGDSAANIIGCTSGTDSIRIHNGNGSTIGPAIVGIYENFGTGKICNNIIGGFAIQGEGNFGNSNQSFAGIWDCQSYTLPYTGQNLISGNTIGNDTPDNISVDSNNTTGQLIGILLGGNNQNYASDFSYLVKNNVIRNFRYDGGNDYSGFKGSIIGILKPNVQSYEGFFTGASPANDNMIATGNQIYNFTSSATDPAEMYGIWCNGQTGASAYPDTIARNNIYGFRSTKNISLYVAGGIYCINDSTMPQVLISNMVSLGEGFNKNTKLYGVWSQGKRTEGYFNSIRITGSNTSAAPSVNSYCWFQDSVKTHLILQNNILQNDRADSVSSTFKNYAIRIRKPVSYTGATNDIISTGRDGIPGDYDTIQAPTLAAWNLLTAQDSFSVSYPSLSQKVLFISTNDLHIDTTTNCLLDGAAKPIPGLTIQVDIDSQARNTLAPDLGADEFNAGPHTATAIITPGSLCSGNRLALDVNTSLATAATYSWATTATIPFTSNIKNPVVSNSSSINNSGVYTVVVTDSFACSASGTVSVNITAGGTVVLTPSGTVNICQGDSLTISATTGLVSYAWSNGQSSSSIRVKPDSATTYTLSVTFTGGCSESLTDTVSIRPVIATVVNQTLCPGSVINFNGHTINQAGSYFDTLSTVNGCDSIINLYVLAGHVTTDTFNQNICTGSDYNFNGTLLSAPGTYTDTLNSSMGCDSIVTLHLAVLSLVDSSFSKVICAGDSYNFNGVTLNTSGTYTDTLTSSLGCDSIITLHLTTQAFNDSVSVNGQLCTAAQTGGSYQWLNCTGAQVITGAVSQSFTATQNGSYECVVTIGDCQDTTSCVSVTSIGLANIGDIMFSLYPNPSSGFFTINHNYNGNLKVQIVNIAGSEVEVFNMTKPVAQFDISNLANGFYQVLISDNNRMIKALKVSKQ